jgi:hypothetical protein
MSRKRPHCDENSSDSDDAWSDEEAYYKEYARIEREFNEMDSRPFIVDGSPDGFVLRHKEMTKEQMATLIKALQTAGVCDGRCMLPSRLLIRCSKTPTQFVDALRKLPRAVRSSIEWPGQSRQVRHSLELDDYLRTKGASNTTRPTAKAAAQTSDSK